MAILSSMLDDIIVTCKLLTPIDASLEVSINLFSTVPVSENTITTGANYIGKHYYWVPKIFYSCIISNC
jgi:hypothetical protein